MWRQRSFHLDANLQVALKGIPYHGRAVDAWSCGVVLFVLLVGNTPWDEPTAYSPEYRQYKLKDRTLLSQDPWNRLSPTALCRYQLGY
jgi:serine/threonine-protein kinase Chk1